jgi:hypothetical protein
MLCKFKLTEDLEWFSCPHCEEKIALRRFADGRFTIVGLDGDLHSASCGAFAHKLGEMLAGLPAGEPCEAQLSLQLCDNYGEEFDERGIL